jgi:diacylglycerol kinase
MQTKTDKAAPPTLADATPDIPKNNLLRSFRFAFAGFWYVVRTQRNFRVQIAAGILVAAAALAFRITPAEWAALLAVMALVYTMEMANTAVEAIVDMVTQQYHPLAKVAKDVAAGAVLVAALFAAGVGLAIFLPRIIEVAGHIHR